jgi:probable HAF family extracellular repeat protein
MKKNGILTGCVAVLVAVACTEQPATAPAAISSSITSMQSAPGYEAIDLGVQLANTNTNTIVINNEGVAHGLFVANDGTAHVFRWSAGAFTDLGGLPAHSNVGAISPGGTVAGLICPDYCNDVTTAYVWRAGKVTLLDLGRTLQLAGVRNVTDDGTVLVVGGVGTSDDIALVFRDGVRLEIPALEPGRPFSVAGMNRRGQVAGYMTVPGYDLGGRRSYLWQNGTMTFLPELAPRACPSDPSLQCSRSSAYGMNDHGDVVGQASDANGSDHAVLWPSKGAPIDLGGFIATMVNNRMQVVVGDELWDNGTRRQVGSLDGFGSEIIDLNDHGAVTGGSRTPDFKVHAYVWQDGTLTELGTPAGAQSRGISINIRGDVIGYYFGSDFVTKAMIWLKVPS